MEWTATGEPLSTNVTLDSVKWLSEDNRAIVLRDWVAITPVRWLSQPVSANWTTNTRARKEQAFCAQSIGGWFGVVAG